VQQNPIPPFLFPCFPNTSPFWILCTSFLAPYIWLWVTLAHYSESGCYDYCFRADYVLVISLNLDPNLSVSLPCKRVCLCGFLKSFCESGSDMLMETRSNLEVSVVKEVRFLSRPRLLWMLQIEQKMTKQIA
jgi:hypothetical protein